MNAHKLGAKLVTLMIDSSFITANYEQPTFKSNENGGKSARNDTADHTSKTNNIHWRVGKDI